MGEVLVSASLPKPNPLPDPGYLALPACTWHCRHGKWDLYKRMQIVPVMRNEEAIHDDVASLGTEASTICARIRSALCLADASPLYMVVMSPMLILATLGTPPSTPCVEGGFIV